MIYIAAVDAATNEILYGGISRAADPRPYDVEPGLSPGQVRRVYERIPDPRSEKDDGAGNLIAKTQAEIDAYAEAAKDAEALLEFDSQRALKALALVVADLTGQTSAQILSLFRAKYRSLG